MALGSMPAETIEHQLRKRWTKKPHETAILALLGGCATISLVATAAIIYSLANETLSFFQDVSFVEFLDPRNEWQALQDPQSFGIWELVAGTVAVVLWSMAFALPIGLAAAVFLSEYASRGVRKILKPALEVLAGVPTVVYAFFALLVVTPNILRPLIGQANIGIFNILGPSIVLAVMILTAAYLFLFDTFWLWFFDLIGFLDIQALRGE